MESILSEVFKTRWDYRLLLRTMHGWLHAVEDSLTTGWLLGLSLSRWRNILTYIAFNQWLQKVCEEQPSGLCTEYLNLDREERRERALEKPAGWHFNCRTAETVAAKGHSDVKRMPPNHDHRRHAAEQNSVSQRDGSETVVVSSDEATEEDSDETTEANADEDDKMLATSSLPKTSLSQEETPRPGRPPTRKVEPPETGGWLKSVLGSAPACCVAD